MWILWHICWVPSFPAIEIHLELTASLCIWNILTLWVVRLCTMRILYPWEIPGSGTGARRREGALEGRPGVQGFLSSLRIAALLLQRLLLFEFSTMPITTESHFTQICIFYLATTRLSCCCFYFGDWL